MNKTEYMLIGSHKRVKQFHNVNIIGNNALKEVYSCKYLGVILDPSLNWKLHIDHVRKKSCPRLISLS